MGGRSSLTSHQEGSTNSKPAIQVIFIINFNPSTDYYPFPILFKFKSNSRISRPYNVIIMIAKRMKENFDLV